MLNIGKLRKGGELYYLNSVARGVEDYYVGSGESPGYWLASGIRELSLDGVVGADALRAVLAGRDPATGERLMNGKPTKRERVPGFDLTFRAPKSISLLHALGDKDASNQVVSAHDAAVSAALDYLERHSSNARRGKAGRTRIASEGFVAAGFRHRTSRAGDPLLHTHVLVANVIKGEDGRWGALDARQLYRHAKTAGYLYQAQLRTELTRRLGVEWAPVRNGAADLEGISRDVIRAFSKRRSEIEEIVGEQIENPYAAHTAALMTRQAKDYSVTPERLMDEWRVRAQGLGLDSRSLRRVTGRTREVPLTPAAQRAVAVALVEPTGLTAQASHFGRREVIQAICAQLGSGAPTSVIEDMADAFLRSEMVIALNDDPEKEPGERRFTTAEMLEVEAKVIATATRRRAVSCGVASQHATRSAVASRPSLFSDQKAMIEHLTSSGHGVDVVVGKAGAGKTFALDAAREAWETSGLQVLGCALSARAAEELELGSGIRSGTITALLRDLDDPSHGGLPQGCVLVVDEAGMVGTRTLDRVLTHAEAADSKVVLVGDDRQLPEIEAGGAFRGIKERLSAIELQEVRRQPYGWERDALDLIREGRSQEAIDAYMAHDRVVLDTTSEGTRERLLADWWVSQDSADPAVMIAARRSDVADLNRRARRIMEREGRLGSDVLEVDGASFSVGDRVMTLMNNRRLGVKNGTQGTIEDIDLDRRQMTLRRDDGSTVTLPGSYVDSGHLSHAYAITGHKAQGMTTDRAFVLGDETLYREWTYVAMSRGRHDNRLYVVAGADIEREEVGGQVATGDDPLKDLTRALARSRAKDLALDSHATASLDVPERVLEL
jgi:Ti-type conjugative transfer relaxase TraA